jgi:protein-S-isoprenylcysteine O-methyltransferase Ste14
MCSENTLQLIMFFTLLILSRFKAAYEEELLRDKFPNYAAYKKAAEMFLPEMKL